jgi:hypothetical protein
VVVVLCPPSGDAVVDDVELDVLWPWGTVVDASVVVVLSLVSLVCDTLPVWGI